MTRPTAVRPVDQLVQLDERLRLAEVAVGERVERDADHLLGPLPHLLQALEQGRVGIDLGDQLGHLRDRHGVVRHPLEVKVDVQHRQDEPQVGGDRRLPREQRLDPQLDLEVQPVDVVVEGDHLVGELDVALLERVQRAAQHSEDERSFLLETGLEEVELLLEAHSHARATTQSVP